MIAQNVYVVGVHFHSASPGGRKIRIFLTFTIVAAIGYPDKRRPARTAYEFIGRLPGSLSSTLKGWTKHPKPARQYPNPISLAHEWQQLSASGEYRSQAHLARDMGVSRARASLVLSLLRLCPHVVEVITQLGDPLIARIITERQLRLPVEQQERRLQMIFVGIAMAQMNR